MNNIVVIMVLVLAGIAAMLWVFVRRNLRGKPTPLALKPGDPLPEFSAEDVDGQPVSSNDLRGRPSVVLFVRGNWCPFCSRQVADLTSHYKEINALGAKLVIVTPKPLGTTRRVAKIFDVQFDFWLDRDLAVVKQLGLLHVTGVPGMYRNQYGPDTVWPTALVCDADNVITYVEQSKRIIDRPDPEILVAELRKLV
ncbi:MAG: peroxiredoxin-like family protein [Woeseia sp.]